MSLNLQSLTQKIKSFLFKNSTPGQTFAKNTFWLSVSNVGGRLIRAFIVIYAARVLGAGEWGAFSYAITLVAFLSIFTDFGMNSILTREVAKRDASGNYVQVLSTAFCIKILFLLISMVFVIVATPYLTNLDAVKSILPLVALILAFDSLRDFGTSLIRAYEKMEWEAGLFIFTNLAIVVAGFLLLSTSPTLLSFTYAYLIGTGAGTLATMFVLRDHARELFSNFSRGLVRPLITSAWPFALAGLLGGLMVNTDVLIIGWMRPAEDVGFYSAAQRIVLLLYILPSILSTSSFPLLSRLAGEGNHVRARAVLEKTLSLSFLLAFPITIGGILLGSHFVSFIFGSSFVPATRAMQVLLLTVPLNFAAIILSNAVFAYNQQKKLMIYAAVGGTLNIILDFVLIPHWGIAGASAATFFVQLVSITYLWMTAYRNLFAFHVLPSLKKIILASILMAASTIVLLHFTTLVPIVIGISALVYALVLYLFRESLISDALRIVRGASEDVSS